MGKEVHLEHEKKSPGVGAVRARLLPARLELSLMLMSAKPQISTTRVEQFAPSLMPIRRLKKLTLCRKARKVTISHDIHLHERDETDETDETRAT